MKKFISSVLCAATLIASSVMSIGASADTIKPKYTVLALDVSSSMSIQSDGVSRLDAEKAAAEKFCKTALTNESDKIAVITFGSDVEIACDFTNDKKKLNETIESIEALGATNVTGALEKTKELFDNQSDDFQKNLVLCSDGCPLGGPLLEEYEYTYDDYDNYQYANAALQYDDVNLKSDTKIYTIGFFDKLEGKEEEFAPRFMLDIATEISVVASNADQLNTAFTDFAKEINKIETPDTPSPEANPNSGNNSNSNNNNSGTASSASTGSKTTGTTNASSSSNSTTTSSNSDNVQTGDTGNIIALFSILTASAITFAAAMKAKKN